MAVKKVAVVLLRGGVLLAGTAEPATAPAYAIGTLPMFWVIQRVASF